ncbi:MAG: hypothetical protein BGN96_01180 [Bacteroidales bacterium 45-6]|nr:MAG: hypothetical protein BGN96_01180 [Bacteroidales bacterium 45-6]
MRIYNYLFYKSYLLAKWSRNFEDIPVLGGIIYVVLCIMLNIFTIVMLLEGVGLLDKYPFDDKYKYPFVFCLLMLILIYYLHKGRYKKIIEKFESNNRDNIHPVLIIIIYLGLSFGLLLLAGLYRNHDWIFAK